MTAKHSFSTSLFSNIEIEIDGQTFKVKPVNRPVLDVLQDIMDHAGSKDFSFVKSFYDEVALVIDAPKEYIDALPIHLIFDLVKFIAENVIKGSVPEEIKNGPKPGDAPIQ